MFASNFTHGHRMHKAQCWQWVFESLPALIYVIRPCHSWGSCFQVHFCTGIRSKECVIYYHLERIHVPVETTTYNLTFLSFWKKRKWKRQRTAMKVVDIQEKHSRVPGGWVEYSYHVLNDFAECQGERKMLHCFISFDRIWPPKFAVKWPREKFPVLCWWSNPTACTPSKE